MPKLRCTLALGVAALLLADDDHRAALETGEAADDRRVVGVHAVAVQLLKVGEQPLDVVERVGRCGWRATCATCQALRPEKMLRVSASLLAAAGDLVEMLTCESSPTKRSSSILASSSAMGCSKSRNSGSSARWSSRTGGKVT
jgi:hypothetical protein